METETGLTQIQSPVEAVLYEMGKLVKKALPDVPVYIEEEEGMEKEIFAYVVLRKSQYGQVWIIPECPHCGKKHEHSAGEKGSDPRKELGTRVPHCTFDKKPPEYTLTDQVKGEEK